MTKTVTTWTELRCPRAWYFQRTQPGMTGIYLGGSSVRSGRRCGRQEVELCWAELRGDWCRTACEDFSSIRGSAARVDLDETFDLSERPARRPLPGGWWRRPAYLAAARHTSGNWRVFQRRLNRTGWFWAADVSTSRARDSGNDFLLAHLYGLRSHD